ncbi:hypothetical protein ABEB36_000920 [Hypothenemus hampei]|uniref:pyruvate dehydrogenase (acetyl-transferring) n=1 Tax=Hypothenemus hampei TaxID=57062 RepID=A0ABD1FCV1_HYPHA
MPYVNKVSKNMFRRLKPNGHFAKFPKRYLVINVDELFQSNVYKLHLLEEGPSTTSELVKDKALEYYEQMDEIRKLENSIAQLYREKRIRGFCHLYVGQEAVAVGINSVMRPQDTIITSYRCHGWAALKCDSLVEIIAELIGNKSGASRGKGGSMHIYGKQFYGGNGIVGSHVPLGVGIGFKHYYLNDDAISVTIYGDGAANQGQVFESFNIAKLHNLPVIFVVENNQYGLGTACSRSSAMDEYYRQSTYIPGVRANGMNILSVIEATKFCFKHILDGKGPIILEMMTYRYFGHSMSDPGTSYRDKNEVKEVRDKMDCIQLLKKIILESNLATEEELKAVESKIKEKVAKATAEALNGQPPPLEELTADTYAQWPDKIRMPRMLEWVPYKTIANYNTSK